MRFTRVRPYWNSGMFLMVIVISLFAPLAGLAEDSYTFVARWGQTGPG